MSSEKENTELYDKSENKQTPANQTVADASTEDKMDPETPKEPEVELSAEEKLKIELEEKNKEIASLKDKLLRQQAQASNDKKRIKSDADLNAFETKKRLLKKMLDIRDNIDRALASFNQDDKIQKVHHDGIKIIASQIDDMFDMEGIKAIEAKGEMYDLLKHEIVARVPYDGPENRVIDVVQKGYSMNGKLLRTAKVAISMKRPKEQPKAEVKEQSEETAKEQPSEQLEKQEKTE